MQAFAALFYNYNKIFLVKIILLELEWIRTKVEIIDVGCWDCLTSESVGGGEGHGVRVQGWTCSHASRPSSTSCHILHDSLGHAATYPEVVEGGGGEALSSNILWQSLHHSRLLRLNRILSSIIIVSSLSMDQWERILWYNLLISMVSKEELLEN